MNKTILIIGADSMVGKSLRISMIKEGYKVIATSRRKKTNHTYLDVKWDLKKWPNFPKCDFLIICASITKLEQCQNDPKYTYSVNVVGLEKAIKKYKSLQTKIIFFSSPHVFSSNSQYCKEDEVIAPHNVYGQHKAIGEKLVLSHGGLVIRVTKIIDYQFFRFKEWVQKLQNSQVVYAYSNLRTSLVTIESLIKIMNIVVQKNWDGIIHISGPEDRSYFEIALLLAKSSQCNEGLIHSVEGEVASGEKLTNVPTLAISDRLNEIGIELPNVETVVQKWCKDFINIKI